MEDPFDGDDMDADSEMAAMMEAISGADLEDVYGTGDLNIGEGLPPVPFLGGLEEGSAGGIQMHPQTDGSQSKRKAEASKSPLKRLRLDLPSRDVAGWATSRSPRHGILKSPSQVDSVKAAAVAAAAAPDVGTGGLVAEGEPRPDFSVWTTDDDLRLKHAMEAGAAMEALAKGALRFSRRYTLKELRARWRALLYDPVIAPKAAAKMVEAEAAMVSKPPIRREGSSKRPRLGRCRAIYYKRKRQQQAMEAIAMSADKDRDIEEFTGEVWADAAEKHLMYDEEKEDLIYGVLQDELEEPMTDATQDGELFGEGMETVERELPRGDTDLESEDATFSQMVRLLAAGGVGALVGEVPIEEDVMVIGGVSVTTGGRSASAVDGTKGEEAQHTEEEQKDDKETGSRLLELGTKASSIRVVVLGVPASSEQLEERDSLRVKVMPTESSHNGGVWHGSGDISDRKDIDMEKSVADVMPTLEHIFHAQAGAVPSEGTQTNMAFGQHEKGNCKNEIVGENQRLDNVSGGEGSIQLRVDLGENTHQNEKSELATMKAQKVSICKGRGREDGRPLEMSDEDRNERRGEEELKRFTASEGTGISEETELEKASAVMDGTCEALISHGELAEKEEVMQPSGGASEGVKGREREDKSDDKKDIGADIGSFIEKSQLKEVTATDITEVKKIIQPGESSSKTDHVDSNSQVNDMQNCALQGSSSSTLPTTHLSSPKVPPDSSSSPAVATLQTSTATPPSLPLSSPPLGPLHPHSTPPSPSFPPPAVPEASRTAKRLPLPLPFLPQRPRTALVRGPASAEGYPLIGGGRQSRFHPGRPQLASGEAQSSKSKASLFVCTLNTHDTDIPSGDESPATLAAELAEPSTSLLVKVEESMLEELSPAIGATDGLSTLLSGSSNSLLPEYSERSASGAQPKDADRSLLKSPEAFPDSSARDKITRGMHSGEYDGPTAVGQLPEMSSWHPALAAGSLFKIDIDERGNKSAIKEEDHRQQTLPLASLSPVHLPTNGVSPPDLKGELGSHQVVALENLHSATTAGRLPANAEQGDVKSTVVLANGLRTMENFGAPVATDGTPETMGRISSTRIGPYSEIGRKVNFVVVDDRTIREGDVGERVENDQYAGLDETAEKCSSEKDPESDEELPNFSDLENMVLDMDLSSDEEESVSAQKAASLLYLRQRRAVLQLEQGVTASMQRRLSKKGVLAVLYGRHLRYLMMKTMVSMGRRTADNYVDIDVGKEGRANKVSRQQALIKLKEDGHFYLRNVGRRAIMVNKNSIESGQLAILANCCLIEVGGMRMIFEINYPLVEQYRPTNNGGSMP